MNNAMDYPLLVLALSFVALWLSESFGASLLRRQRKLEGETREDFGVILAAALTLLALIIGFSFSMAISRYDQRKNYEEAEANAIVTGIVVGTYSSVFVAGALVVVWEEYREKRAAAARTGRPATVKS